MNQDKKLIQIFPTLRGRELLLEDMDLPVSVYNGLKRREINTLDQLLELTTEDLPGCFLHRKEESCNVLLDKLERMATGEIE